MKAKIVNSTHSTCIIPFILISAYGVIHAEGDDGMNKGFLSFLNYLLLLE
jgi:hypothetical protein